MMPPAVPPGPSPSPMPSPDLGVPTPPVPPRRLPDPTEPPVPKPPTITEKSVIAQRLPAEKIKNPFERTAAMIVDAAEDYARRLAEHLSEQAADTMEADPQTVHEMMNFSKYGTDAPRVFWDTHDRILEEAVRAGDPDPYAAAERGALDEVYPYRAQIALLDVLGPEERVKRADELSRLMHQHIARGNPPEALPFLTGPAGLPTQAAPEPAQTSSNGRQNGGY